MFDSLTVWLIEEPNREIGKPERSLAYHMSYGSHRNATATAAQLEIFKRDSRCDHRFDFNHRLLWPFAISYIHGAAGDVIYVGAY